MKKKEIGSFYHDRQLHKTIFLVFKLMPPGPWRAPTERRKDDSDGAKQAD